jgi:hypothetical protein
MHFLCTCMYMMMASLSQWCSSINEVVPSEYEWVQSYVTEERE